MTSNLFSFDRAEEECPRVRDNIAFVARYPIKPELGSLKKHIHMWKIEFLIFFIFVQVFCYYATLTKSDHKSEKKSTNSNNLHKLDASLDDGSLKELVNYQDILEEHNSFSVAQALVRNFNQDVLGYVTPWNNHGYDVAKLFSPKFTMISPVWLQLKSKDSKGGFVVAGLQDIDKNWVAAVKHLNKKVKKIPEDSELANMVAKDAKMIAKVANLVAKNDANLALPSRFRQVLIGPPL
ncbi:chitinase domain-containing protein 1 [Trichonephila clavipes]|nr:chitinase domain-containing protein 1 [Trichonephila clavipes]